MSSRVCPLPPIQREAPSIETRQVAVVLREGNVARKHMLCYDQAGIFGLFVERGSCFLKYTHRLGTSNYFFMECHIAVGAGIS